MAALFPLGQVTAARGAISALVETGTNPLLLLERHVSGDWGDVPAEDAEENEFSLRHGFRIVSSYLLDDSRRLWIMTESDRSLTTFLLPDEY
jgi:hypothetical protein